MDTKMYGTAKLTARREPWMDALLANPARCQQLIETYGSPVNVHEFSAMERNAAELRSVAEMHDVDFQIYFARKANKTLGAIEAATRVGCGVDVASFNELQQCLDRGVPAKRIIVTAAVKSRALLELAITAGVTVSLDNETELREALAVAHSCGQQLNAALRLAVAHPSIPPTRFGLLGAKWLDLLSRLDAKAAVVIEGIHFHLNGYEAQARSLGITEALGLIRTLKTMGQRPSFVDMGGGIPMSYLEDGAQWQDFWAALGQLPEGDESLTWKSDRFGSFGEAPASGVYPYHQELTRGAWLHEVLAHEASGQSATVAAALRTEQVQLRCEPGRSLLDGCGLTLAEVAFTKERSDGMPLVGLHMNRTQCRSTSADFLVDPVLVHAQKVRGERSHASAFLVGAYCIEEELILRRRFEFPASVGAGDMLAIPNTAGYLMHIVESASHQLPLAANVLLAGEDTVLDEIDLPSSAHF